VLTKTDLLTTQEQRAGREQLMARLRTLNPSAPILDAGEGEATAAHLIDCGLYRSQDKSPDVRRWLKEEAYAEDHHHHHHDVNRHDDHIRAFVIATDEALPVAVLDLFLELLRSVHGPNLLRLKGIVKIQETPEAPVVVHGIQHLMHPIAQLESWPDDDRRTRLVFIMRDTDPATIRQLFDAFVGHAATDRPDRAAVIDNPLVPFGGLDR
jgi:G3E family GTPase